VDKPKTNNMIRRFFTEKLKRPKVFAAIMLLLFASLVPILSKGSAAAYGLITARSVRMSSSAASATGVSYLVTFTAATNGVVRSIVVDFCDNSPILNDSCTATVGTNVPNLGASPTVTTTGGAGIGNLTDTYTASQLNANRTLVLTAQGAGDTFVAGNSYFFTITGVANPSNAVGTFYGRIMTFPNAATSNFGAGYTTTNLDTNIPTDAGGVALSTAQQITITSKVQEQLDFCMYYNATAVYDSCAGTGNAFSLGDTNGVLSTAGVFVDKRTRYNVRTNAQSGVTIRMRGTTLTHPNAYTIDANAGANGTAAAANDEQFGICTYLDPSSTNTGITPVDGYDGDGAGGISTTACAGSTQTSGTGTTGGDNGAFFKFDDSTTLEQGTNHLYGSPIATKAAGDWSAGIIATAGGVAYTTEAGIYTTTLTFIATGVY
jgi:hypothetical protein